MKSKKNIATTIGEYLIEHQKIKEKVDFDLFPDDILETLEREYGHYYLYNFDWNTKQSEFMDNPSDFTLWLKENGKSEFLKNIDKIITKVRQDLIIKIKQKNADKVLKKFEELIIPVLGNSVLTEPLNKFMEISLLHLHSTKEIEDAYRKSKNVIDSDGSLNTLKTKPSNIFVGGEINLPKFEIFVDKNPEYKGVFNDWKKLFDKYMELSTTELNAFRDSTSYKRIKKLYDFLIQFKNY